MLSRLLTLRIQVLLRSTEIVDAYTTFLTSFKASCLVICPQFSLALAAS